MAFDYRYDDIAWAAGLFEGEGAITVNNSRRKRPGPKLVVSMTDLAVLQEFQRAVGGLGRIYGPYDRPNRKPTWTWAASSFEHAQQVLVLLWPRLSLRRRVRAQEVFATWLWPRRAYQRHS